MFAPANEELLRSVIAALGEIGLWLRPGTPATNFDSFLEELLVSVRTKIETEGIRGGRIDPDDVEIASAPGPVAMSFNSERGARQKHLRHQEAGEEVNYRKRHEE